MHYLIPTRVMRDSIFPPLYYIYTLFTPREVPKPRISLFSLDRFSLDHQSFIFRNILPFPPFLPSPLLFAGMQTRRKHEREKCIDLKKTNGIDFVVSRDYARTITRKKTNQSIAIRSIKRNHHPEWWTIRLKRKVKEVIYLCSLDGLFYLYILDFCARGQQSLNDYYYYYYVFNFSFSFSFCAPLYIHQSSSQRPTVP